MQYGSDLLHCRDEHGSSMRAYSHSHMCCNRSECIYSVCGPRMNLAIRNCVGVDLCISCKLCDGVRVCVCVCVNAEERKNMGHKQVFVNAASSTRVRRLLARYACTHMRA